MLYQREIKDKIEELARFFPVLVLSGARQTGKTTLLKSLFPKHQYVTLDLPLEAEFAEESPEEFLKKYSPPVLIDEVQYAPKLFRHLKFVVDSNRETNGQFILTGSQKFTLMKEVSDSLAGRCALLELENLSIYELGSIAKEYGKSNGSHSLLSRGFYPELWKNLDFPVLEYYRSYFGTYLERDVRQILNVGSLRDFERFIRICATRSGNLLNKSDIAKDVGVTLKTINDWLSVLQASNQISLLEPYFENVGKRLVKTPKIYFNDTGLLCFLLGLDKESVSQSHLLGAIFETFIFGELRKYISIKKPQATIWFYRDQTKEIDFVILESNTVRMIETKWTERPDLGDVKSLKEGFFKKYQQEAYICSRGENSTLQNKIKNINFLDLHSLF